MKPIDMTETSLLPPKVIVRRAEDLQQRVALLLASISYAEQQARTEYEAEHECVISERLHRHAAQQAETANKRRCTHHGR